MIGVLYTPDLARVFRTAPTGEKDRYGKPIVSRALVPTPDGRDAYAGQLQQAKSVEGEAFTVDSYVLSIRPDADVRAGDEVVVDDSTYQVEGRPVPSRVPGLPAVAHLPVALKYVGPVA